MFASWLRLFSRWQSRTSRRKEPRRRLAVRYHWRFEVLEDRLAPATFMGGVSVASGDVNGDGILDVITGAGQGGGPHVKVFSGADGSLIRSFMAYDSAFTGGVNVASGDINGDGFADIVTGPGPGMQPLIKIFNGRDGSLINSFMAYDAGFLGGVNVAVGDVEGDGRPDIITAPASNGLSNVKVFRQDGSIFKSFFAYDSGFYGGVSVAAGDIQHTGRWDIITGAGPGGGPHVKVYDPTTAATAIASFMAYSPNFGGGVHVAAGDVLGDGNIEVITGAGAGGGPHVQAFNRAGVAVQSFMAYDTSFGGGVNVASFGAGGLVTGAGKGGGPHVKVFQTNNLQTSASFFAYEPNSTPSGRFGRPVNRLGQPFFDLDAASDTGVKGDQRTTQSVVNFTGTATPGVSLTLTPTGATTTADSSGNFTFTGVSLNPGPNPFTVQATDGFGNQTSFTQTFTLIRPPTVSTPIPNQTVAQNAVPTVLDLSNNFTLPDGVDTMLRLNTSAGPIDIELFDQKAPQTVANFLNYVNSGRFNSTIFHRLASNFVLQGGGFTFQDTPTIAFPMVPADAPVRNEFGMSNVRGTLAMAKLGSGPDTATSQFFFNLGNNSANLDAQNGGFTVFAQVINNTMSVVDQLAAASTKNESATNGAFDTLPLVNYNGTNFPTDATRANFEILNALSFLKHGDNLAFSVTNNTNPTLVTPTVAGNKLTLTYASNQTGTSTITVRATEQDGLFVETTFTVTVS